MVRRLNSYALVVLLVSAALLHANAQTPGSTPGAPPPGVPRSGGKTPPAPAKLKEIKPTDAGALKDGKAPTAEQVAESVIFVYGSRPVLAQIRHNGIERGQVTRTLNDGKTEEINYERYFLRGESSDKDKIRLDQKMPSSEYALVFNQGQVWGVINGTAFTPRQEAAAGFLSQTQHNIDALLRYKENGSTLAYIGKDKQKNIEMWIVELTNKNNARTRYYISAQKGRVLWLEYEEPSPSGGTPIKYRRAFHDYRYAQNTLVPYRTVLYANDKPTEETRVLTVTYGIKIDDALFQNPQAATNNS